MRFDSHCTSIGGFHHRLLADTSALLPMEFGGVASVIKASVTAGRVVGWADITGAAEMIPAALCVALRSCTV